VSAAAPAIRFTGLSKHFAGITALDGVSFEVAAGSCHALCGENGAGKSTLGKILAGIHLPDSGTVELFGRPVRFSSPRDARDAGVAMVHQELSFCDNLTVGENLCLGALPRRFGLVDRAALRTRAQALLAAVGVTIDPDREMRALSVAEQQLVQIAAAVGEGAKVIVFDEPTSSLGVPETEALFRLLHDLRERGVTIVYVSHRMPEIFALCDAITVLRDGRYVDTQRAADSNEAEVVRRMIGRAVTEYVATDEVALGSELLRVERLSSPGRFRDVSFTVRAGEVVGLAGLVGAGRSEIAQSLFGLDPAVRGDVHVRGISVTLRSARQAMQLGLGFVPEDRKKQGLVLSMKGSENATLPILDRFARAGWIDRHAESTAVRSTFERLRVRAAPDAFAGDLSGGNQQKMVMAKWLAADAEILLLDEPTRGVDVATKAELHAWIGARAAAGAAVLMISSELPELLKVATRIVVLRDGVLCGELSRAEATQEGLMRLMTGVSPA
jgi:ABC-type sugar transport system ATPase subunit